MLRDVWTKTVRDQRRALLAWSAALVLLVGMYAGFYPSFHGSNSYNDLINQMPKALRDLFTAGAGGDLSSGPGYIYMEMLSFMAPTLLLVFAIGAGAQAVAGEEERHTLELLLATPLTRARLVIDKWIALALGASILASAMGVAIVAFGAAVGMGLSTVNVVASMVHLILLALVFGSFALLVGAATGRVALARGIPAAVAVVAYLVNGFGVTVSWLTPVRKLSPFFQYVGHDPIRTGFSLGAILIAAATVMVLVVGAVRLLRRRDITG
ncbi:MAG TPA: ABC transporter permease subunit [Mycobacteriales bacterium]|jgi:ABC-2 type transport system permease protein|nr:ABC transporter permease subunit [Mycobacteriales bacterium]